MFFNRAGKTPKREKPARFFFVPRGKQAIKESPATPVLDFAAPQHHVVDPAPDSAKFSLHKSGLVAAVMVFVAGALYLLTTSSGQPEIRQFGRTRAIQLDVLNGSGEAKLAQKLTEFLRSEGFDVVEMGNYKTPNVPHTMVIDRAGNGEAARVVAASLGIAEERVVQQVDKNLFLDVTVVIGKDFASLKAFQ